MTVKEVLCIGAGYVGGPTMSVIADRCPDLRVTVADINAERIRQWNSGDLPVYEPGLDAIVKRTRGRNLFFEVISPEAIARADLIFVSVNTPTKDYGEGAGMAADLRYWDRCARDILAHARGHTIVVEKSTVPVRTAEAITRILNSGAGDRQFAVLSNPEFLAEGTAIRDLEHPDRVLIGGDDTPEGRAAASALKAIYARWVPESKILLTNVWSSELSKLVANAMLAQRVSSINAVTALCERTQADVAEISRAVGMDSRIGPRFLEAGVGFGGSCFGKDILNLAYICGSLGLREEAAYWNQVVAMNDHQIARFAAMVVEHQFRTVAGKRLAIFGFAFKPNTNDTRDSPAIRVCRRLLEEQARLAITDPQALDHARRDLAGLMGEVSYEADPYRAAEGAHAIVLVTHWPQFRELDYRRIYDSMAKPAFLFDGRAFLDKDRLAEIGFNVYPIGSPPRVRA
jgi:UDPglucose 6-dehydrogenase